MDVLGSGLAWMAGKMESCMAVSVAYTHNGVTAGNIPAVIGTSDYQVLSDMGVEVGSSRVDFIIKETHLGFTPTLGDIIVYNGRKYKVVDHGGAGCWRWTDGYCISRRIHTEYYSDNTNAGG